VMQMYSPVHNFAARCPSGHRPAQSRTLAELRDPEVRFYCTLCSRSWRPQPDDRSRAVGFAEASEHTWQWTPPTAA
jgi:hypothetical protein